MAPPPVQRVDPAARTVCDLFVRQTLTRPEATAIRTADRSWTYAELGQATARLAARLGRRGVRPGAVVGVVAPRGPQALIGFLAVMRAGAAVLPVDPADPPQRIREILGDAGCEQVLAAAPADWLPDAQLVGDPTLDDEPVGPLPVPHPLDLAYAITTSGSTGRPKAVGVPHRALLNLMAASIEELDLIRPDDVMLWSLAPTVDSTMHDVLMPLCVGGTVAVPDGGELPANRMVRAVRTLGATVLEIPSAVLGPYHRVLLPRLAEAGVRAVITGGSQLDAPGLGEMMDRVVVFNGYGPTETTVAPLWHRCDRDTPPWVPIGRPHRGVRVYVLDEKLAPVPDGAEGQLYVGGAGVARGYLGLPGRTASVFLPDPFAGTPGERMYATGDRVRRAPDGTYVFVGRIDDQVKLNGYRVEIGEVEHALKELPGVLDAAALLREDAPGGAALVAFLVGDGHDGEEVAERLRDRLPNHMVPRFYVWLERLPLNRPGKIDRRALAKVPFVNAPAT
ncbi:amino acid adenylation domain-containing protein [Nonomuraea sp. NPDC050783]|uniref:amino acid adenylation domain-containing protein n=1 Tax=Nonomuraea sp. NPDC050783 TaxID=3154634 RepID=UPI0034676C9F